VYGLKLDTAERARIEKLEIFDEFEEWDLLQSHYCLALGKRFADSAIDKKVHI
jgi:tRNA wybutosine-synthesizing protein 4